MERINSPQRQAEFFRGLCTAVETIGKMVYVSGPKVGSAVPVRLAEPEDGDKMPSIGVVVYKFSATECLVQQSGQVSGIFSGLEEGKTYKVGTSGSIQRLAPVAGVGGYAWVQFIGHAVSEDVLYLSPEMQMAKRLP